MMQLSLGVFDERVAPLALCLWTSSPGSFEILDSHLKKQSVRIFVWLHCRTSRLASTFAKRGPKGGAQENPEYGIIRFRDRRIPGNR
jgi:hypothetical protein